MYNKNTKIQVCEAELKTGAVALEMLMLRAVGKPDGSRVATAYMQNLN